DHARQQKEEGSGLVRPESKPVVEVFVDGNEIQSVIEWKQYFPDNKISDDITKHHLKVGELRGAYLTGNGDERNARQARTDHPEGYKIPGRFPVAGEEGLGGCSFGGDQRDYDQY